MAGFSEGDTPPDANHLTYSQKQSGQLHSLHEHCIMVMKVGLEQN